MKKSLLLLLFGVVCLFMVSAEGGKTIKVINSTGYEFYYLYISPSDWDNWEEDLLKGEYLQDGEERVITLSDMYGDKCVFDVKAVDLDDDTYTIFEVDLCTESVVEVTMDNYDGGDYEGDYDSDGYEEGYQEGYKIGYREAFADAYRQGYMDGFTDGKAAQE